MKKYKKTDSTSYTLGTTLTMELLNMRPELVRRIYTHSSLEKNETYDRMREICRTHRIEVVESDKTITALSDKENCYMLGLFDKYSCTLDSEKNHVVLVNPSNMGNLGTIIRTSVGFGIRDLALIRPAADIFDPKTVRASMGALLRLRFQYFDTIEEYLGVCGERRLYPFMLDGAQDLKKVEKASRYSLVFGNESAGLPAEYQHLGQSVLIRHGREIDSLNLDNAASIALYEFTKDDFTD